MILRLQREHLILMNPNTKLKDFSYDAKVKFNKTTWRNNIFNNKNDLINIQEK